MRLFFILLLLLVGCGNKTNKPVEPKEGEIRVIKNCVFMYGIHAHSGRNKTSDCLIEAEIFVAGEWLELAKWEPTVEEKKVITLRRVYEK